MILDLHYFKLFIVIGKVFVEHKALKICHLVLQIILLEAISSKHLLRRKFKDIDCIFSRFWVFFNNMLLLKVVQA